MHLCEITKVGDMSLELKMKKGRCRCMVDVKVDGWRWRFFEEDKDQKWRIRLRGEVFGSALGSQKWKGCIWFPHYVFGSPCTIVVYFVLHQRYSIPNSCIGKWRGVFSYTSKYLISCLNHVLGSGGVNTA